MKRIVWLALALGCAHASQKTVAVSTPVAAAAVAAPAPAPAPVKPPEGPGEHARRLMDDALLAQKNAAQVGQDVVVQKFQAAAEAAPGPGPALYDLAVALDRAGRTAEAEKAWLSMAQGRGELAYLAGERAVALAIGRGDPQAARAALELAEKAALGDPDARVLRAEVENLLGDAQAAQSAARSVLTQDPKNVRALCALARAHLKLGSPGTARVLAARAAGFDAEDALPLIVKAEIARAENEPAAEVAAARAAVETDGESAEAALLLGRALFERGLNGEAVDALARAADLDKASYPAALALGQALASSGQTEEAEKALTRSVALAPKAAAPHLELARLKLDGDNDAQAALTEAKLFLTLSTPTPPPGHPVHALVQRCEEALKQRAQASIVQPK